ncbi:dihydroxyacetone kinase subunit DhaK [Bacillus taeanensis]|uniref:Dihydroxyacetone kinase subunit DhaK n=1 Tax=Bacillus taeanensis TaxID=273032 RepID=A0A366XS52_9BACI|nr:dihydroxyacetone kinase subunit DhaK [Bacillus taeanensis]RBW68378.1 dihydroxyacetone kinase subunit DhaK [Bacillus taeanensis]
MKKLINKNENIIEEMVDGFIEAYGDHYKKLDEDFKGVVLKEKKDKVAVVVGGGTGHEPLFIGFVGEGLADGAAIGNVFAAPTPGTVLNVTRAVDSGKGVLYIYGNYSGDILNFDMAAELAEMEDLNTETVLVRDDVASAPIERIEDRRGISGDVFVIKVAGAAADLGLSLEEVTKAAQKASDQTRSIGVALSSGTIPGLEKPTFSLPEDEIEFGMGIHGEPGIQRTNMMTADELTDKMLETLLADFNLNEGDEVCMLVNGLGSTSLLELMIVNRRASQVLKEKGISIYHTDVNSYCTSQEMAGVSISLMRLDDELKTFYNHPAHSPYYTKK